MPAQVLEVMSSSLTTLQQRLGYTFRDPALLECALTHPSFLQENTMKQIQLIIILVAVIAAGLIAHVIIQRHNMNDNVTIQSKPLPPTNYIDKKGNYDDH